MKYKNKKIIIFGASKAGERAYEMLKSFGFNVIFFLDNNTKKFETTFLGKKIKSPDILKELDMEEYFIVIASMFYCEISKQLNGYNLVTEENYTEVNSLIKELLESNFLYFTNKIKKINNVEKNKKNILITLPRGLILGGIENWSITVNRGLKNFNSKSYLVNLKPNAISEIENTRDYKIINLNFDEDNYINALVNACNEVIKYLPCTIINNDSFEILQIAYILKKIYPNYIKVISVLHGDADIIYHQNVIYQEIISNFICVSQEISESLIKNLPKRTNNIVFKISPIEISNIKKEYSCKGQPIKIGFAGRLVKEQKRCDYLLELIKLLESKKVNYEIHIAGAGPYYDLIEAFIIKEKLENKIMMYGLIPYAKMDCFWNKIDVYLNLSDYEGTSLAMLEAMGNGIVPIVTNVSGVNLFVKDAVNGFIINKGDIASAEERILYILKNREILQQYGKVCREIIIQRCSMKDYIEYLLKL
ncbi:glycosyltransferase [Clostridium hydrogenum]|uniref:glycosyltransferase n=1 Tax=Clostridium hydrogenum TaxID=2855764 RepID=UPI001F1AD6FB|nr:glycosyltransferase [Clostridium hydrogenum]